MARPVVSSFWHDNPLSDLEKMCINSFLAHGFDYHLYVYKNFDVPDRVALRDAREILNPDKIFRYQQGFNEGSISGFANLFRYYLLYKKGGVWVDTDTCLLSDSFGFTKRNVFILERGTPDSGKFANGIVRCRKKHPIMRRCIEKFKKFNKKFIGHGETGPELLTKVIQSSSALESTDVELKEKDLYYPIHWEDTVRMFYDDLEIKDEWKTIHFWNAWVTNELNLNKNGSYPRWSIYERLKDRYLN